ncbi:DUF2500 domain-containing protein [Vibrio sp.]|uniref:DUF2500 domain-containing protein n=1 Tax=Vibrio sp. TaxID=678 RepID=UPI003D105BD3
MPIELTLMILLLITVSGGLFGFVYRRHVQGRQAPERQLEVTILDKQVIDIEAALPGQEQQQYWIYVQRGQFGSKREFQVSVHYYHALNPGDSGLLTYQGDRFIHFALKR